MGIPYFVYPLICWPTLGQHCFYFSASIWKTDLKYQGVCLSFVSPLNPERKSNSQGPLSPSPLTQIYCAGSFSFGERKKLMAQSKKKKKLKLLEQLPNLWFGAKSPSTSPIFEQCSKICFIVLQNFFSISLICEPNILQRNPAQKQQGIAERWSFNTAQRSYTVSSYRVMKYMWWMTKEIWDSSVPSSLLTEFLWQAVMWLH